MEQRSDLLYTALLFSLPIVLGLSCQLLEFGISYEGLFNFLENIFFVGLLWGISFVTTNPKWHRRWMRLAILILVITTYFETVYYHLYQTYFSPSSLFVIFESNFDELSEFISFYLDKGVVAISLLFLVCGLLLFKHVRFLTKDFGLIKVPRWQVAGIALLILVILKWSTLIVYNVPYLLARSTYYYAIANKEFNTYKFDKLGPFDSAARSDQVEEAELYVIVLGESVSRHHLGIYGYYRETTPKLTSIAEELVMFEDVVSPHVFSIAALTKILTLGNHEHPELSDKGSVIQMLNGAGFKTFWLSNQRPVGPFENLITKVAMSADQSVFLNTVISGKSRSLDEKLLPEFESALKDEHPKKVIFLHLLGVHHAYEYRYPGDYSRFKTAPKTAFPSSESFEKINHYDNALHYQDSIVFEVIRRVRNMNTPGMVLYTSDHGEEVYDIVNLSGHNEDKASKNMFDVPFVIWPAQDLTNMYPVLDTEQPFVLDDFIHALGDLLRIDHPFIEPDRSLLSPDYRPKVRIVGHDVDYDAVFQQVNDTTSYKSP